MLYSTKTFLSVICRNDSLALTSNDFFNIKSVLSIKLAISKPVVSINQLFSGYLIHVKQFIYKFFDKAKKATIWYKIKRKKIHFARYRRYWFFIFYLIFFFKSVFIGHEENGSEIVIIAQEELDDIDIGENRNAPTYLG